ncbi:E3 SUMO-protein ligase NSE2-like [Uloborus diversus]|uniref:E3 SUMO-protein ligase NSE2-like n=1 Tax=Uloborus diversus TaxID=327109 RepID=UPI002409579F|nr:E3 SUMO-protein ligase NSE2-like [Uloborus diversus]
MDRLPTLDSVAEQLREFQSASDETFKHCTSLCLEIEEFGSDIREELSELKNSMIDIARLHKEGNALYAATMEMKSTLREADFDDESAAQEKFQEILSECLETEEIDRDQNAAIDAIEASLSVGPSRADGDSELFVTDATETYLDPLTKKTIEDPVKSRLCNHAYERSSIMKFLQKSRKCPYSGCHRVLRREDLVEDLELKKKLLSLK